MNTKEIAQALFATHPGVDSFHITSDGTAFAHIAHAEAHARSLADGSILTEHRDAAAATEHEENSLAAKLAEHRAKVATKPNYMDKLPKAKLLELANSLGCEPEPEATNDQIIAALKEL